MTAEEAFKTHYPAATCEAMDVSQLEFYWLVTEAGGKWPFQRQDGVVVVYRGRVRSEQWRGLHGEVQPESDDPKGRDEAWRGACHAYGIDPATGQRSSERPKAK